MIGDAVNVTFTPLQIVVPGLALIETDGATAGVIVIVNALLVAVVGTAQDKLLVSTVVITSLFTNDASVYDELFTPTLTPFFFH